jgi:hypothetical protein
MGTSLTGLTPSTTYDALIKVGDNGPLSGTLKTLSDGLGNDSALALSTGAASVTGTLTASGLIRTNAAGAGFRHFYNNGSASIEVSQRSDSKLQLYAYTGSAYTDILLGVDGSTVGGNVGIGTPTPEAKLDIKDSSAGGSIGMFIENAAGSTLNNSADIYFGTWGGSTVAGVTNARISAVNVNAGNAESNLDFYTYNGSSSAKRISVTSNGLTFNGDTAAANALDDYEEGTWTMGVSFGGASSGITYNANTGTYTKIGRQVTVNGYIGLANKGTSTGSASITGLPFTIANFNENYSVPSLRYTNVTFLDQFQAEGGVGTTTIDLTQITNLGAGSFLNDTNFANNSSIIISFTYFV